MAHASQVSRLRAKPSPAPPQTVSPDKPQIIVELGAGTGAITVQAVKRMHPKSRLIAIEIDPDFASVLAHRCPRAEVICCDVKDLAQELKQRGVGNEVDIVLSGLPTPSLPKSLNQVVLEWYEQQAQGGRDVTFSQLTVMPWVYWRMYARIFQTVRFQLVALNSPPGGVYYCNTLRPDWRQHIPGR
jgi:phosphatidylethanolamine/phosphatidyl-N-methylethanolamine N-methyltransferase